VVLSVHCNYTGIIGGLACRLSTVAVATPLIACVARLVFLGHNNLGILRDGGRKNFRRG
jgi:hypothetical protein